MTKNTFCACTPCTSISLFILSLLSLPFHHFPVDDGEGFWRTCGFSGPSSCCSTLYRNQVCIQIDSKRDFEAHCVVWRRGIQCPFLLPLAPPFVNLYSPSVHVHGKTLTLERFPKLKQRTSRMQTFIRCSQTLRPSK